MVFGPLRVARCAVVGGHVARCAVVGGHVARCAVVSGRVARWIVCFHTVGSAQVALCVQDVIFQSCALRDAAVVQKLGFSGVAQPLRDARCAVVSDHSRCVAAPLEDVQEMSGDWTQGWRGSRQRLSSGSYQTQTCSFVAMGRRKVLATCQAGRLQQRKVV